MVFTTNLITIISFGALVSQAMPIFLQRKDTTVNKVAQPTSKTEQPHAISKSIYKPSSGIDDWFNIVLYKPGVPYLHMRTVKITKDNTLVVNGDSSTVPFAAYLSSDNNLVSAQEVTEGVTVDSEDSSLKVGLGVPSTGGIETTNLRVNSTKPATSTKPVSFFRGSPKRILINPDLPDDNADVAGDNDEARQNLNGPWNINEKKILQLKNESLAWSCPMGKSGVYKIFWTQNKPKSQSGCLRVDLYVPDSDQALLI